MPHDTQPENTTTTDNNLSANAALEDQRTAINFADIDLDGTVDEGIVIEPAGPRLFATTDPSDGEDNVIVKRDAKCEVADHKVTPDSGARAPVAALPLVPVTLNGTGGVRPEPASGKAARIERLIAEGKGKQAMTLVHAIIRHQARKTVRRGDRALQACDALYFLRPAWREQYSGQDIVAIAQTLAKGVDKGDAGGTSVLQVWHDRIEAVLARRPDRDIAAIELSQMIVIEQRHRNTANRRSLANGLTEIQVQVAELTGRDPEEYVHPILVADLDDVEDPETSCPPIDGGSGERGVAAEREAGA